MVDHKSKYDSECPNDSDERSDEQIEQDAIDDVADKRTKQAALASLEIANSPEFRSIWDRVTAKRLAAQSAV
jgi:hypothetical protein